MTVKTLALAFEAICADISERCWCAGWMSGLEDTLPGLCMTAVRLSAPAEYGQDEVSVAEARALTELAEALGGWQAAFAAVEAR